MAGCQMVEVQRKCLLTWVREGRDRRGAYQCREGRGGRRHRWVEGREGHLGGGLYTLGLEQRGRLPEPRRRRGGW